MLSSKWNIYIDTRRKHWGKTRQEEQGDGQEFCGTLPSRYNMAVTFMVSQLLGSPVQDEGSQQIQHGWGRGWGGLTPIQGAIASWLMADGSWGVSCL